MHIQLNSIEKSQSRIRLIILYALIANLDELQSDLTQEQESYKEQIEELKERCSEKQHKVQDVRYGDVRQFSSLILMP